MYTVIALCINLYYFLKKHNAHYIKTYLLLIKDLYIIDFYSLKEQRRTNSLGS